MSKDSFKNADKNFDAEKAESFLSIQPDLLLKAGILQNRDFDFIIINILSLLFYFFHFRNFFPMKEESIEENWTRQLLSHI